MIAKNHWNEEKSLKKFKKHTKIHSYSMKEKTKESHRVLVHISIQWLLQSGVSQCHWFYLSYGNGFLFPTPPPDISIVHLSVLSGFYSCHLLQDLLSSSLSKIAQNFYLQNQIVYLKSPQHYLFIFLLFSFLVFITTSHTLCFTYLVIVDSPTKI